MKLYKNLNSPSLSNSHKKYDFIVREKKKSIDKNLNCKKKSVFFYYIKPYY